MSQTCDFCKVIRDEIFADIVTDIYYRHIYRHSYVQTYITDLRLGDFGDDRDDLTFDRS